MRLSRVVLSSMAGALLGLAVPAGALAAGKIYNTVKEKLAQGKQVVGGTVSTSDPNVYCAMATAGFDFLWIEMQHSPLTHDEVAHMIRSCPEATAIPFVRVPDATEGDIQKAADNGALGIIVPMVENMDKIKAAVRFAKYPPIGKRSQGGGQYRIWGDDYRQTANDNIMIVAMIESPAGVAIADQIASLDGVDVVFAASTDLGSFSGHKQGEGEYEALVTKIHDAVLKAGRVLAGPVAWKDRPERPDFRFFQGPGESSLIHAGAKIVMKAGEPEGRRGVAPTEGAHP
jgi:2-keto-3-deoxy-L-rhamnonate aldolase RhmA